LSSGSVTGEDKVTIFDGYVTGIAAAKSRLADGFAIVELGKPPTPGRGVFPSVDKKN
jgi:hypothetical protein